MGSSRLPELYSRTLGPRRLLCPALEPASAEDGTRTAVQEPAPWLLEGLGPARLSLQFARLKLKLVL